MDSRLGRGCNCSQQAPKAFAPSARVGAGRPRLGPCGRSRRWQRAPAGERCRCPVHNLAI